MQHPMLENARFCFMKRADAQKLASFQGLVSSAFWYGGTFSLLMREFQQVVGRPVPTRTARGFPGGMRIFIPIHRERYARPFARDIFVPFPFCCRVV